MLDPLTTPLCIYLSSYCLLHGAAVICVPYVVDHVGLLFAQLFNSNNIETQLCKDFWLSARVKYEHASHIAIRSWHWCCATLQPHVIFIMLHAELMLTAQWQAALQLPSD